MLVHSLTSYFSLRQLFLLLNDAYGLMIIKEHNQTNESHESTIKFTMPAERKTIYIWISDNCKGIIDMRHLIFLVMVLVGQECEHPVWFPDCGGAVGGPKKQCLAAR